MRDASAVSRIIELDDESNERVGCFGALNFMTPVQRTYESVPVIRGQMRPVGNVRRPARRSDQGGYAFLLVLFMVVVLLISLTAVVPGVLVNGRREREQDMIWRGEQYKRGIRLYSQKMGKYPTSLEDLVKHQNGTLRFMRKLYPDPMAPDKGEWRLIYVTQGGMLVGSLRYQTLQQLELAEAIQTMGPNGQPLGGAMGAAMGGAVGGGLGGFGRFRPRRPIRFWQPGFWQFWQPGFGKSGLR